MQSTDPEAQRNLLIAVVLSMLVMLGWQFFVAGPKMQEQQERAQREQQIAAEQAQKGVTAPAAPGAQPVPSPQAAAPASGTAVQPAGGAIAVSREEALKLSPRVAIDTPSLSGSIALKGGSVDDLVLKNYRDTVDPKSPNVVLFSPAESQNAYFAKLGWLDGGGSGQVKLPGSDAVWTADKGAVLTPSSPVVLTWDNGQGLKFKRTFLIDDNYMISYVEEVENASGSEVSLRPFALIYRLGTPKLTGGVVHEGLIGVPGDAGLVEIYFSSALEDGGSKQFANKVGGWLGITDLYWAAAVIPDQKLPYLATLQGRPAINGNKEFYTADYTLDPVKIAAGAKHEVKGRLFAGAKQVELIENYEKTLGIEKFELLIDWGWFYFITKPLNHLITWLYGILGNFGLAILAVTVLVKLLFFPLSNKSYESMAKMKKLQPQMEALRERHKDDKARQQQALMELYQKEKINPLAGCLPILVQIPVFFALYKVLFVSIDMRHAPFVGWIHDLSAADPTSIFNLFGLLPFGVPAFLMVGAWPVIMGLTMWFQMQLNPPQPDPVQQAMFTWMPLIFTFLLASFPAGLVIYWAWNNVLSIAQQWYISKKQGADIHLGDNLRKTFAPLLGLLKRQSDTKKP